MVKCLKNFRSNSHRYNSKRLHGKALLYIDHLPMVVHIYRRTKMSNLLDDVIVCCENKKSTKFLKNIIVNQFLPQRNIRMELRDCRSV